MPRNAKKNATRKTPVQILESLTQENVTAWMREREELGEKVNAVGLAISAMIAANMSEEHIEAVRKTVSAGAMERLSYLENNVRRTAIVMTKAAGFNHWKQIVSANIGSIPTAAEKLKKEEMAKVFGNNIPSNLPY